MLARFLERRLDQQRHLDGCRLQPVADAFLEEMDLQGEPRHELAGVPPRPLRALGEPAAQGLGRGGGSAHAVHQGEAREGGVTVGLHPEIRLAHAV